MIDKFVIFSKTGIVLWSKMMCALKADPVENLVKTVLLEERSGGKRHQQDDYTLQWTFANEMDLVFVVVYQKILTLMYIDDLLEQIKGSFMSKFPNYTASSGMDLPFDDEFVKILRGVEMASVKQKKKIAAGPRTFDKTKKGKKAGVEAKEDEGDSEEDEIDAMSKMKKAVGKVRVMKAFSKSPKKKKEGDEAKSPKKKKNDTSWHTGPKAKVSKEDMAKLDMSGDKTEFADSDAAISAMRKEMVDANDTNIGDEDSEDEDWEEEDDSKATGWSFGKSTVGSFFNQLTGNKVLDEEDLEPVLEKMREQLIGKNVATEVAQDLCDSVSRALVGQKLENFTLIGTQVKQALEEAMTRILTAKKSTDVLREVKLANSQGRPYVVVFVGVNGVGKSTSLSKVCYYLKSQGCKMLIAACDTFRSGAVEQLRTHCNCLGVDLFERGYAKDPAQVAGAAVKHAQENNFDCLLIDTAGRMQNNEPLMRALAKLVSQNPIDLTLFVGEALVGNDGIDQLNLFNKALIDYGSPNHIIDGIVLTKFDTIDDKVGAALSMSYQTGQPIMFVGTGQKYNNLKKLNVRTVIKALLS